MGKQLMRNAEAGLVICLIIRAVLTSCIFYPSIMVAQESAKKGAAIRSTEERPSSHIIDVPSVSGGNYVVAPGSKGNQLVLSFVTPVQKSDGSAEPAMDSMMVWVKRPAQRAFWDLPEPKVHFTPWYQTIRYPYEGNAIDASFTFEVDRDAGLNRRDTIEFLIVGRGGPLMSKKVTLSYGLPINYQIEQNFPNPFNPTTTIYYQLPADSRVTLEIYDIHGREVRTLVDEQKSAGYYTVLWDATNNAHNKVSSGVYIYRIDATGVGGSGFNGLRKMILLK